MALHGSRRIVDFLSLHVCRVLKKWPLLVCVSSWEKWVFPQEVNASASPLFFSYTPPTFHSVFFFLPPLMSPFKFSLLLSDTPCTDSLVLWSTIGNVITEHGSVMSDCLHFHLFSIRAPWRPCDYTQLFLVEPQRCDTSLTRGQEVLCRRGLSQISNFLDHQLFFFHSFCGRLSFKSAKRTIPEWNCCDVAV